MGADFSDVNIHENSSSATDMAHSLMHRAMTYTLLRASSSRKHSPDRN